MSRCDEEIIDVYLIKDENKYVKIKKIIKEIEAVLIKI